MHYKVQEAGKAEWRSTDMIHMGKMIRNRRKQLGLTQVELGEGIMSKSVLSRVENGMKEPDIFELQALLERLESSLEYFEVIVSDAEYEQLQKQSIEWKTEIVVIPEGEFLKDMRKAKGFSQEQLSEGICARETISNIENGRTPNRKIVKTLSERLGESWVKYFGYVETTELALYPVVKNYQRLAAVDETGEIARGLLEELEARLDVSIPVNRQFIESSDVISKRRTGKLKEGEALAALEKCLRYTMPEYDGSIYRIPHLQEEVILEEILLCMKVLKRGDAAGDLSRQVAKKRGKKIKVSANVTAFTNSI